MWAFFDGGGRELGIRSKAFFVTIVIVAGIVGGFFTASAEIWRKPQTFPRGTTVLGIDIGGRSRQEAVKLIERKLALFYEMPVVFERDGVSLTVKSKELGARLAIEDFLDQVMSQELKRPWWGRAFQIKIRSYPLAVPVTYDKNYLERLYPVLERQLGVPAEKAWVSWDGQGNMTVRAGRDGLKIDKDATYARLPAVYRGEKEMRVKAVTLVEPCAVDRTRLARMEELASFTTYFDPKNENRTVNLRKAALALHGAVIPPSGEFSFNSYVGPRSASLGYKEALVVVRNELTPGVGGGICQVSSTLYNACLLAGLEILERHNHSVAVPYVAPGLDATVTYSHKDLRFRNNTGSPICIKVRLGKERLEISIWGRREQKVCYQVERQVVSTKPFSEVRKPSADLCLGQERVQQEGMLGYTVNCYLRCFDGEGNLLGRKLISHDVYQPLTRIVLVGTKASTAGYTEVLDTGGAAKEEQDAKGDGAQDTDDEVEKTEQVVPVSPGGEESQNPHDDFNSQ